MSTESRSVEELPVEPRTANTDTDATETLDPARPGCGWRGSRHRPTIDAQPRCPHADS